MCPAPHHQPSGASRRTIFESKLDKALMPSSGQPNRGDFSALSSCPRNLSAHGARTSPMSWHTHLNHISTDGISAVFTSRLSEQAHTLCVCRAPGPNDRTKCCVLDAASRVITCLRMTRGPSAGAASPKPSGSASSTRKSSGSGSGTGTTGRRAGRRTGGRKCTGSEAV